MENDKAMKAVNLYIRPQISDDAQIKNRDNCWIWLEMNVGRRWVNEVGVYQRPVIHHCVHKDRVQSDAGTSGDDAAAAGSCSY